MSGLNEVRRWVNLSKLEQRVYNPTQGNYETILPGGYVEGKQYVSLCNAPSLRETTAHLTVKDFTDRLPQEKDVELLKRLSMIERNEFHPRDAVVKMIDARIAQIYRGEDGSADTTNDRKQSEAPAGSVGSGTTTARP